MNQAAGAARPRSTFVTVVAWVFIVLAGFATLIALMQATMFGFLFSADGVPPTAGAARELQSMPPALRLLVQNVWVILAAFWAGAVLVLVAAIGLLRRKNWARVMFIALMGAGIVWNLIGLWLQRRMLDAIPRPPHASAEMASGLQTMATVMGIGIAALAVVIAALLGWIAIRLMSRAVRAEFRPR